MSSNSPRASRDRRQFAVLPLGIGLTIGDAVVGADIIGHDS